MLYSTTQGTCCTVLLRVHVVQYYSGYVHVVQFYTGYMLHSTTLATYMLYGTKLVKYYTQNVCLNVYSLSKGVSTHMYNMTFHNGIHKEGSISTKACLVVDTHVHTEPALVTTIIHGYHPMKVRDPR